MAVKYLPKSLTPGAQQREPTAADMRRRAGILEATVRKYLPEFVKAVEADDIDLVTLHQDAFAAGMHDDEYTLLGMAIKFAGLRGRTVVMSGTNGETCK